MPISGRRVKLMNVRELSRRSCCWWRAPGRCSGGCCSMSWSARSPPRSPRSRTGSSPRARCKVARSIRNWPQVAAVWPTPTLPPPKYSSFNVLKLIIYLMK